MRDAEAVVLALKWFEENKQFGNDRDKELLISFSPGFTSTGDDSVNTDRAADVRWEVQIKLDAQSVTSIMDVKSRYKTCRQLDKFPWSTRRRFTSTH